MYLDELLKKYKFIAGSKRVFRNKIYRDTDGLLITLTKDGSKAYGKLINLLYDIQELLFGFDINSIQDIIDTLDYITLERY